MIILLISLLTLTAFFFATTYSVAYCLFLIIGFVAVYFVDKLCKPAVLFVLFYLAIALLNISTWRGYTEIITLKYYILGFYFLILPMFIFPGSKVDNRFRLGKNLSFVKAGIGLHLLIAYLFVIFIYSTKGVILINQSARFGIPTGIEYAVKSTLPLAAFIPFIAKKNHFILLILFILPSILLGYRGTSVLAVVSYGISFWYANSLKALLPSFNKPQRKSLLYILFGLVCVFIVFSGFYLRRTNSSELATVDVLLNLYFDYSDWWVYLIIPFYLGFKETIGLTNSIITENIRNTVNEHTLFFADLFTVLPGERLAAGQSLGKIFGTVEDGGLTPGLLGGVYIDYGSATFLVFFMLGIILKLTSKIAYSHVLFFPVYSLILTQFIHLFHRGFLKPEYLTSLFIALFYYLMINKIKL